MIKTALGNIKENALGVTLPHEHICCFSEYLYRMGGSDYLDKKRLLEASAEYLARLKREHCLSTFIDCTPVNIGRDIELLKRVSEKSEVNVILATGFYYTDDPLLYNLTEKELSDYMIKDAQTANAGVIKCAVENERISGFEEKLLRASARAQLSLGLPIVLHTNAKRQNAVAALEILLSEGVEPRAVTVGHLSDSPDLLYLERVAAYGAYIGLDRLYGDESEEYISQKVESILSLAGAGYGDKLLLSHDALFFNGFEKAPKLQSKPRFSYVFEKILPRLPQALAEKITVKNPMKMLSCK